MFNKLLVLSFLFVMGSCSKDELMPKKVVSKINSTKLDSTIKSKPKKKKFRLFNKKNKKNEKTLKI